MVVDCGKKPWRSVSDSGQVFGPAPVASPNPELLLSCIFEAVLDFNGGRYASVVIASDGDSAKRLLSEKIPNYDLRYLIQIGTVDSALPQDERVIATEVMGFLPERLAGDC